MGEDKQKVIIVLLVINIILICIFGIDLRNLKAKNDMLVNQINNLSISMSNLDSSISDKIQNALDSRDNMVDTTNYKYTNIDVANNMAALDFTVKLKAVKTNSRIYLAFGEVDASNVQEIELAKKDGLLFGASVELDLNKNYQYDVIEKGNQGEEALLNVHKQYIYLYDEFYSMRIQAHSSGSGRSTEDIGYSFSFSIDDFGMAEFGLDRVQFEVWYEGKAIDTADITDNIVNSDNSDLLVEYNIAVASGRIDSGISIDEFRKTIGYERDTYDTRTYYTYTHSINYDVDYPELKLDMEKAKNMYFKFIITCKDGYRLEL